MILIWTMVGLIIAAVMVIIPALRKVAIVAFGIGAVLFGVLSISSNNHGLMWLMLSMAAAVYVGRMIVDAFTG